MNDNRLVRDYENSGLPIKERVPSLARRFSCLKNARGVAPWSAGTFHSWVISQGEGTAAWHAGHLILNLSGVGPWARFDAISAVMVWNDDDRTLFATWARSWR
jgi:hypothetical protein